MSKVIVFFADGTEECEALLPVDLLRRAKIEVVTASVNGTCRVTTSHGVTMETDTTAEQADYARADMLVLPGGMPGTVHLGESAVLLRQVEAFVREEKWVAAICAAPSILGKLGLLAGRRATSHASFRDKLTGAQVVDEEVVVDGCIITSYGLGGAIPFALELVRRLAGEEEAARIGSAIEYVH